MADPAGLLLALQHGDSFFPSGGTAFSWGIETLGREGLLSAETLPAFIAGQLAHRWASCERPMLAAAHAAAGDLDRVQALDDRLDMLTLARELREGSRRNGGALLAVHERLGTPNAAAYRRRVRAREAPGHLAVMQGLLWAGAGLDQRAAAALSAHMLCVGLLAAALRLGLIGHVAAQRCLAGLRPLAARLVAEPPRPVSAVTSFAPEAEIAVMRHEAGGSRLFAN